MALTSNIITRQAYARIGAWQGNSQEINAQYNADVSFEQIVSESFPPQSMWDMLTGVENEIATAVAKNPDNTLRDVIFDTATATSGGRIPSIGDSSSNAKIIGEWGQVRDTDSGQPLTRGLHQDEIRAISQDAGGIYKTSYFSYVLVPPRIYATVTNLSIDVCVFNEVTRAAAIAANGNLLFQQLQNCYLYGLMSGLKNQDPLYTSLSDNYTGQYQQWLLALGENRPVTMEAAA